MENRKIILKILENDRVKPSDTNIGHEGEHLTTDILIEDKGFDNFFVHLVFKNTEDNYITKRLEKKDNYYFFSVPTAVLKQGKILCQLLLTQQIENSEEIRVKEYSIFSFYCGDQIKSNNEIEDKYTGLLENAIQDLYDTFGDLDIIIKGYKDLIAQMEQITINNNTMMEKVNQFEKQIDNKANKSDIPTKVGQLTNDSEYINKTQLNNAIIDKADKVDIPTKVGQLDNDSNFITKKDIENKADKIYVDNQLNNKADKTEIPTNTSQLTNNSGYITNADIEGKADKIDVDNQLQNKADKTVIDNALNLKADKTEIPTKVSVLENDSKFANETYVNTKIADLVDTAPETLDTLGEIAKALQDEQSATGAIMEELGKKENTVDVNSKLETKADKIYVDEELNKKDGISAIQFVNKLPETGQKDITYLLPNEQFFPDISKIKKEDRTYSNDILWKDAKDNFYLMQTDNMHLFIGWNSDNDKNLNYQMYFINNKNQWEKDLNGNKNSGKSWSDYLNSKLFFYEGQDELYILTYSNYIVYANSAILTGYFGDISWDPKIKNIYNNNGTLVNPDPTKNNYNYLTYSYNGIDYNKNLPNSSFKEFVDKLPKYELPKASVDVLGGVKVGENLTIDEQGKLNADLSSKADKTSIPTKVSQLENDSGFTKNYNNLDNKPQINGVTLEGNKTSADLKIGGGEVWEDVPTIAFQPNGTYKQDFAKAYKKLIIQIKGVGTGDDTSANPMVLGINNLATSMNDVVFLATNAKKESPFSKDTVQQNLTTIIIEQKGNGLHFECLLNKSYIVVEEKVQTYACGGWMATEYQNASNYSTQSYAQGVTSVNAIHIFDWNDSDGFVDGATITIKGVAE